MTFELFVYRAQMFAMRQQQRTPGKFVNNFLIGLGAVITQSLMAACFARTMMIGESQWRKQRSVTKKKKSNVGDISSSELTKGTKQQQRSS